MELILGFLFGILAVFPSFCMVVKQRDQLDNEFSNLEEKLLFLERRIKQAMQITYMLLENSADNRLVAKEEEIEYFDWLDETLEKQLKILKGEDNNDNK